ncbi:MAG: rhodanese-like domain-containing protein [Verrucomicrobiae bacterium]|nr:rhodanese-like domain-containing protein [Verrucomicrobiae bacterium]NNJ42314.1 rhodanese-like domain-containing protein [Akkermansiaceae bacterium]
MRIFTIIALMPLVFLSACKNPSLPKNTSQADQPPLGSTVKPVDATAMMELITQTSNIQILDLRTPAEFAAGHIKGSTNIDFKSPRFADNIDKLDKRPAYILYCRSGNRSRKSLETFKKHPFGTIYHLEGGFNAWQASGNPVEK